MSSNVNKNNVKEILELLDNENLKLPQNFVDVNYLSQNTGIPVDEVIRISNFLNNNHLVEPRYAGVAIHSIRIKTEGCEYLSRLQNEGRSPRLPLNKKTISIIITIVIGVSGIGGSIYFQLEVNQGGDIDIDGSQQVIANSGFGSIILKDNTFNFQESTSQIKENGLIYRNETLGFEIARPNLQWYFDTNMSELKIERTGTVTDEEFLGGVYVGTSTNENVFVSVFDITDLNKDSLEGFVDAQTKWVLENFNAELKLKEISPNKKWAIFGIEAKEGNQILYGEQILEIRENKLYMLQYTGVYPDQMESKKLEEFRTVIDSFKPFP